MQFYIDLSVCSGYIGNILLVLQKRTLKVAGFPFIVHMLAGFWFWFLKDQLHCMYVFLLI